MTNHRQKFLYTPVVRFIQQLSPGKQAMLTIAKLTLIVVLVGFQLASINGLV